MSEGGKDGGGVTTAVQNYTEARHIYPLQSHNEC